MTFPDISSANITSDLSQTLVYANNVTGGFFVPGVILFPFFMIVFLGSAFMQMRFSGKIKFDVAFLAASFSSFGLSVILSIQNGLLSYFYVFVCLALSIIGLLWVMQSENY